MPKFRGKTIVLGDVGYVVPPIALGDLRDLQPRLAKLDIGATGMPSGDDLDTIIDMTFAALRRNYPEITRVEIGGLLDMGNLNEIVMVVMGQAGLEPVGKPELAQASP
jgi:hypothetical protein